MKLKFIDSPKVILPKKSPPETARKTSNSVKKQWSEWAGNAGTSFPAAQLPPYSFTPHDLAVALMMDSREQVPYQHALELVSAVVDSGAADLSFHKHLQGCSQRFKSLSSEWMATMVSIAYASKHGLGFLGSMADVNKLFRNAWTRRWKGNGPDCLFINFNGGTTFLEIKGRSSPAPAKKKLVDDEFVRHKVQSMNAELRLPWYFPTPRSPRYVLSRVTMEKNSSVKLQWFNQAPEGDALVCKPLVLAVAFGNFLQIARAQGVELRLAREVGNGLLQLPPKPPFDVVSPERPFDSGSVFLEKSIYDLFMEIERAVREIRKTRGQSRLKPLLKMHVDQLFDNLVKANLFESKPVFGQQLSAENSQKIVTLPMGYKLVL